MITNKSELYSVLLADLQQYRKEGFRFYHRFIYSETYNMYKYVKTLRYLEYYKNNVSHKILYRIKYYYFWYKQRKLSTKYGITIAPNTTGSGLCLMHPGFRRIGPSTKIGTNCTILPNVLIGKKHPGETVIEIGNNCYIGTSVTILGPVKIGNNVTIGAGAVVLSDIPDNSIVGGVPAKVIKYK